MPLQTHQSSCLWAWSLPLKFIIPSASVLRGAVFPVEQRGYSGDLEFLPIQCRLVATEPSEDYLAKVTFISREERNILIPGFLTSIVFPFYYLLFFIGKWWNNVSWFWDTLKKISESQPNLQNSIAWINVKLSVLLDPRCMFIMPFGKVKFGKQWRW